jgi:hypothetical protein
LPFCEIAETPSPPEMSVSISAAFAFGHREKLAGT